MKTRAVDGDVESGRRLPGVLSCRRARGFESGKATDIPPRPLPAVVLAGCAGARSPRSNVVVDPCHSPPDRPTHMHPRHCRHREEHQTARILSSTVRRHEPARPGHRNEIWRKPVLCATCGPGGRTHGSPRMLVHFRDTRRAFSCMPRSLMSPHSPAPSPRMSRDVRRLRTAVGV